MSADDQLKVRLTGLRAELDQIAELVAALDDPTANKQLRATLQHEVARLGDQLVATDDWSAIAGAARSIRRLAAESMELSSGLATRGRGLDDGLCALADVLLYEVSTGGPPWVMATIPADSDFFNERDHVIRLRWPGDGVWTLPLALHELGHFVGRRLETSEALDVERWAVLRPFEERLSVTGEEMPADWHHLHELFADAYAVYVGGPAYLACCVTVGFDPTADASAAKTHPAPSRRVAFMVEVLTRMNGFRDNSASLAFEIQAWQQRWTEIVTVAGTPIDAGLTPADIELVDVLWAILHDHLPNARYRTLNAAKSMSGQLLSPIDPLVPGQATMADVVNALWCARRERNADPDAVARRGRTLLEMVAASRG